MRPSPAWSRVRRGVAGLTVTALVAAVTVLVSSAATSPAAASAGDTVAPMVASGTTGYTQSANRSDGTLTTTWTIGGTQLAQSNPAVQTMPQRNSNLVTFSPNDVNTAAVAQLTSSTTCITAVLQSDCGRTGTITIAFDRPVTNPTLHVSGLGGYVGAVNYGTYFDITGATALGTTSATATFGQPLAGSSGLTVANGRLRTTATRPSPNCGDTSNANSNGPAGCGSVVVNGTNLTSITLGTGVLSAGGIATNNNTAVDAFNLTMSTPPAPPFALSLTKTNPASLAVSNPADYTLTVTNAGPGAAPTATVVDKLPAGMIFNSSGNANWSCTATGTVSAGQTVTCTYTGSSPIASGASSTVTVNVTPGLADANQTVRNVAAVDPTGQASPVDPTTCTATGTPAGCAVAPTQTVQSTAFTCTAGDIYALDGTDHNVFLNSPADGSQTLVGNIGAAPGVAVNALAITNGTGYAYAASGSAVANGRPTIYKYDPATNTTTTFNGPTLTQTTITSATTFIAGAINPVNGIYYFGFPSVQGGNAVLELYGFDTTTDKPVTGRIATVALPGGSATVNGDLTFDRLGRMYFLATTGNNTATANPLLAANAKPGATGSDTAISSRVIAYLAPNNATFNGMAFDLPTGYLYVTGRDSSGQSFLKKINPTSGAQLASYNLVSSGTQVVDAASCNYNNSLIAQASIVNRAGINDQFTVSVNSTSMVAPLSATTSGSTLGLQDGADATAGPAVTVPGTVYTATETAAGTTNLANYTTTYRCTNLLTDALVASGTGTTATFTFPTPATHDGLPVGCVFTNTAYTLSLTKTNPASLTANRPSTYTFGVVNAGPGPASSATVVDALPANVAYTSFAGTGWTCTATGTVAAGQTVTCTFTGTIAANATNSALSITVTPNAASSATTVQNKAAVDPTGGANPVDPTTCTATGTPAGCAVAPGQAVGTGVNLALTKSAPAPAFVVGYPSTYTLTLTNSGVNAAAGATVREQLPTNTVYVSAAGAACTVTGGTTATGQQLTCTVPSTTSIGAGGGTAAFTIAVTPLAAAAGTNLVNRAAVDPTGGTGAVAPSTCTATGTPAGCALAPPAPVVADVVRGPSPSRTTPVGTPIASIDVKTATTSAQGKTIVNPAVTTQPANGTASVNADGTLRYAPNAGFSGADSFTYTICNDGAPAACDTETVSITVTNVFTPGPDITTPQNTSVTTPLSGIATTTGKPLDPTRVTQVTAPAHGSLTISATTGAVTYVPAAGYTGTDSYQVQVCDTSAPAQCTTITKKVTVGPNVVTAVDDTATTAPATPVSINVRANDTSQTGQPLASPSVTAAPAKGSATVNSDGTILYTPTNGRTGTDTFTYRVCDTSTPTPVCASATVTVSVPNTVTANNDSASTPQNTAVTVPLLANDTVSAGGAALAPGTVTITTNPGKGSVTVNATTGAATYTPANGYTGTDTFAYRVCDTSTPTAVCASATVTVSVGANTVTAVNDSATTTPGTAVSTDVRANDTTATGQPLGLPVVTTNPTKGTAVVDSATGRIVYTPNAGTSGVDTYKYQVCDTSNPTPVCATATVTVTVANTVTAVDDTASTPQNTAVTTPVTGNDTVSANGAPLDRSSVAVTTAPAHGTTGVNATTGAITYTPANGYTGTDTYRYRVCDTSTPTPVCSIANVTVTVGANTVTANDDTATTTPVTAVTTNVRANDSSATGQPLAVPTVVTNPAKGSVAVNANGTITYTPNPGTSGTDTYRYRVCDTSNPTPVCAQATVTVTVANTVTATDDIDSTPQNTARTTSVLGNDTVSTGGAPLAASSVTVTTNPLHGTTAVNATTGAITYTPANGYTGTDTYRYRVCDTSTPTPVCASANVTITVGANTVTAVNDTATTTPGIAVTTDVRANDTSSTGQPLAAPTVPVQPAKGTVAVNANGTITYTPNPGTSGVDTYTYRVCDTSNPTPVCAQATVTVTVTNTVTAVNDTSATAQNTPVTTAVLANDTVSANGAALAPNTVAVTSQPAHGVTSVNTTTGAVTYTPANGYTGTDTYTYRVCDTSTPTAVCASATVTITVGGNTVTANDDTATTTPGTGVGIDVRANDVTTTGQPLANPTILSQPAKGTVTVTAASGRVIYTPAAGTSGTDSFTYRVCDTSNPTPVCSTATVRVTVQNTVTATDDAYATPQNTAIRSSVLGNDRVSTNGAPLDPASVAVTANPAHGTAVANADGTISYTPAIGYTGTDTYRYQVCDTSTPTAVCGSAAVTITIGGNVVTAANDTAATTPRTPVTTDVRANDTSSTGQPFANPTVVTQPGKGSAVVNADGTITYTPTSGTSGIDSYQYRVCDTSTPTPVCDTATVTVTVQNTVTAVRDTLTVAQNTAGTADVVANDTVAAGGAPLDRTSVTIVSGVSHGTATVNPTSGVITYTPNAGFAGVDVLTYQVCDSSTPASARVCGRITLTITVTSNVVTARNDTATTTPGTPVTTDVRANDTSATGQALATPTIVTNPARGTVSVNADGTITYTPTNGTSGTDTYTYQVCDTSNPAPVCSNATVTIAVPNAVTAADDTATTAQNTSVTTAVLANDTVSPNGSPLDPASVLVSAGPAHGTTTVNTVTGAITYTPTAGYTGTDSYGYQVCDSSAPTRVCRTATVTVTVGANTVTANADAATTTPGVAVTVNVRGNDTSASGQSLATPTIASQPGKGTATVNADGTITYAPAPGTSGVDTFTYRVCDTGSTPACDTGTVTITVPNAVTAVDDTATTPQNTARSIAVLPNDTVTTGGSPLDPGSVTVVAQPAHGSTAVNTTTGAITYTPAGGFSGTDSLTYRVCDASTPTRVCGTATATITVGANTVVAADDSATTRPVTAVGIDVRANDTSSTGQPLAVPTVGTAPAHGTTSVDATTGVVTYTPASGFSGTDSFTYRVCDTSTPTPVCASARVTVTVTNTVTAVADSASTPQNTTVTVPVLGNDTVVAGGAPLDPSSVAVTTAAAHGTTTVNSTTGAISFVPANGFTGTDTFRYQVCDTATPTPNCGSATVTVTVGGNAVSAGNDSASTAPGSPVTLDVRGNDTTATGQPLANPTIVTAPARGDATVNADGTITYRPAVGTSGTDTFTYRVCDTSNPTPVCAGATVSVAVTNVVTAVADSAATPQNTAVRTSVLDNDTVSANGAPLDPGSVTVTGAPAHGTTTVNAATGAITYTPANGYSGPDAYTYRVCDTSAPAPVCASAGVTLTVGGNTVVANADSDSTTPGTAVTTAVRANDSTATGQPLANPTVIGRPGKGSAAVNADGTITYTPAAGTSGTDSYTYRVCDTSSTPVCATAVVTVTVTNTVTARNDADTVVQNGSTVTDVLANDSTAARGAPLDPTSVFVTGAPSHGTTSVNGGTGAVTYTPTPGYNGPDSYTYQVCDRSTPIPVCASAVVTITVTGDTVTARNDTATTLPGNDVSTDVRANDTTSTGQPLANPVVVTQPSKGSVVVNPDGTITYRPDPGTSGTDSYTYRVCDTGNPPACATAATVIVTAPNTVTAVADTAATGQNRPVTVPVLANDTVSENGAPLDPSSVTVTTAAGHGSTAVDTSTGAITYTPAAGFTGTDSFRYRVCDGSTPTPVCDSAMVTVSVGANMVAANDDTLTTTPGRAVSADLRANDSSSSGQPLAAPTVTIQPAKGTVTVNGDGSVTYRPDNGTSGVDTFTYRVCDTGATPVCATATVTVQVTNTVTASTDSATVAQNGLVSTPVLANDTVSTNGAPLDPAGVTVTGAAAHGTTSVDATTGAITYTPDAGYSGPDSYTYQVCDTSTPTPVCDRTTVTITVTPNTVTANPDTITTNAGQPVTVDLRANDVSASGQPLAAPTVTTAPTKGAIVVNADGTVTYTPTPGSSGTDTFAYTVCDTGTPRACAQAAGTATITVVNVVTAVDDSASVPQNGSVRTDVLANDTHTPGGAPLDPASVTVTTAAQHGTTAVDAATGAVTYRPASGYSGTDSYTYRVCDTSSPAPKCATATVSVTVGANTVSASDDSATTTPGNPVTTDVRANDSSGSGQPLANPTITTQPTKGSVTVDAAGTVTYTPRDGTSGQDSYSYRVCDTGTPAACDTATVTVDVVATVTALPDSVATGQNRPVDVAVLANDSATARGAGLDPTTVTITTAPGHGSATVDATTGVVTYTPDTGYSGPDSFTYRVCDASTPTRTCASATATVTVGGNTVAAGPDSAATTPGVPVTTDVRANDTSSSGQPLAAPTITVQPAKGTVLVNGDGTVTYTPAPGTSGSDTYTYRVCDTGTPAVCDTATVTVSVANTVTAVGDSATTAQNTAVTTAVLGNDTVSPGGAPLDPASVTVSAAPAHGATRVTATGEVVYTPQTGFTGSDSYTYRVCDSSAPAPVCDSALVTVTVGGNTVAATDDTASTTPGTPVTIDVRANDSTATGQPLADPTVVAAPAKGDAVVGPAGSITYTPRNGTSGTDTFTYRVCDTSTPTPVCATATVTVTVTSTVTVNPDTAATAQNTSVTTPVLANDTVSPGGAALQPATVAVVTAAAHGTTAVDTTTGAITYVPDPGYTGADSYAYRVCDGSTPAPVCGTATVTVSVGANTVGANDDAATTAPGTPVSVDVRANDTSASGQSLAAPAIVSAPAHGTAVVDASGAVVYTPADAFSGSDSLDYRVCDTGTPAVCSVATLTVAVPNTVTAVADTASIAQNGTVTTPVLANDTVTPHGAPLDPTTVTVLAPPAHGTATPTASGAITYTPAAGYSGPDSYGYQVCDTSAPTPVCARATVTVTVGANTVTATADSDTTTPGRTVRTDVRANDSSSTGQPLARPTVVADPAKGTATVDAAGTIAYTPTPGTSGTDTYTYRVCDTGTPAVCDTATVTITVANTVTAVPDTATTAQNTAVTTAVLANDTVSAGGAPLDPAGVTVTGAPLHGTTGVTADGSVTYTPDPGYSGPDSYRYQACDTSTPAPVCSSAVVTITVGANAVTVRDDTATVAPGGSVTIDVRANDTSASGQPLAAPGVVATPAKGTVTVGADGTITYRPAPGTSGTDTFTYRVCDTGTPPACGTATVTVRVPTTVTAADDVAATPQNTAVTTTVLANDSVSAGAAPLDPASVAVTGGPAHGTAAVNADGTVTYTPAGGFSGTDTYRYQVCDTSTPTAVCAGATVTVTVGSNVVVANADTTSTAPGVAVTTDVRANDSSATGQPLGAPTIVTDPARGTATVNADGTVTYTPRTETSGTDTYTYRVCDTSSTPVCDQATVTVEVANGVVVNPDAASTAQNAAVTTPVLANDAVSPGGAPLDPATVAVTTAPTSGTTVVNPATGAITYQPDPGFSGADSYGYTVCDGSTPTPVCGTAVVTITVGGNTVTAVADTASTTPATPVTTDVRGNDTSATGQPLAAPTIASAPAKGTATVNADGTVTYSPRPGTSGTDSYAYRVCDTGRPAVCDTATVTIAVTNTVTAGPDSATVAQNGSIATAVLANDTVSAGGAPLDPASVTVAAAPAHGTTTVAADGTITYRPDAGYSGPDSYAYRVCDTSTPAPVCANATVTVSVGADTVTASPDADTTTPGIAVTTDVRANDSTSTGQPLDAPTVVTGPSKGTVTVTSGGSIRYVPDAGTSGTDSYTYRVCDTGTPAVCDTATVTITVTNTVTARADTATVAQNGTVRTPVLANDSVSTGGAPLDPASVTVPGQPAHGTVTVDQGSGAITYTPDPGYSGPDGYTYRVCDTSTPTPVCASAGVTVAVTAGTVTARDDAATTAPGNPVTVAVLGNDASSTGQPLALPTVVTAPARGTATVGADGTITYTPDEGTSGRDTLTYRVCDTGTPAACDTATVTVTVPDTVTARDDTAATAQNAAVRTDVLANDTVSPHAAPLDPASVTVGARPAHGTTTVHADGSITYTPAAGYSGADSYTYRVCDTSAPTPVCDTATVTVSVGRNTVAANPDSATTTPGAAVTTNVLANDTSSTGQALADPTVASQPAHGSAVVGADGTITYTPDTGFSGTDSYTYQVCDTGTPAVCRTATVTVAVVNTVTARPDRVSVSQNGSAATDVLANDTVSTGGAPLDPASVTITAVAAHGTTVVGADGSITYTPDRGYSGPDTYTYRVCDTSTPTPVCDTAAVAVTVAGGTVTARDDTAQTTPGNAVTVPVLANDSSSTGQALAAPAVTAGPAHGTAVVDAGGAITYTPDAGFGGTDTVTYRVCDTGTPAACDTATLTVDVLSTVTAVDDAAATPQDTAVRTPVLANDTVTSGGAPLDPGSVRVTAGPAHGTTAVDLATGAVTYTPDTGYTGPDSYDYRVCDTSAPTPVCDSATVTVTVGGNVVVAGDDSATTTPGRAVAIDVRANDSSATGLPLAAPTVQDAPAQGSATVRADGTIVYTPAVGTSGTDTVTYQVCDTSTPTPVCDTATVTVTVANDVTAVDDDVTTPQNTAVTVDVLGNDTVSTGGAPLDPASVAVLAGASHGTTSVGADGTITYVPATDYSGTDTLTYQVCDRSSPVPVCDAATVTVVVGADVVTAVADSAATTPGTSVTTDVRANDTSGITLRAPTVVDRPAHGSAVVGADGTITYTPDPRFSGTDTYTYRVCDTSTPTPVCDTATVTVTVANTVSATDDVAATPQNTAVDVDVVANDTADPLGAPLDPGSVTVTAGPAHGTVSVHADGSLTYTPANGYTGKDTISYRVCDTSTPTPVCGTATVTVTVGGNVVRASDDTATTRPGTAVGVPVERNDTTATGQPLGRPTVTSGPDHGTATPNADGTITYTPSDGFSGIDTFTYRVCDTSTPTPVCDSATVTVTVPSVVTAHDDRSTTAQNTPVVTSVLDDDTVTRHGAPLDPGSVRVTSQPAHGTVTVHADGTITFTPQRNYSGPDSYTYRVCDTSTPTPVCDSATVTIGVAPNVVTANDDTATTTDGSAVTTPVLGNDTVSDNGAPLVPSTVTITTQPAHGTVAVDPVSGAISYTPDPGWSGSDSYGYQVCDASVPTPVCDSATVTVRTAALVPGSLLVLKSGTLEGGQPARVGATVSWTIRVTNTGTVTVTDLTVSDPTGGRVSCPRTTLAGGQSVTCTVAGHTVTTTDLARHLASNTATAAATGPAGPIASAPATAVVTLQPAGTGGSGTGDGSGTGRGGEGAGRGDNGNGGGGLAFTGTPVAYLLGSALLALVVGAGLALAGRRRRSRG